MRFIIIISKSVKFDKHSPVGIGIISQLFFHVTSCLSILERFNDMIVSRIKTEQQLSALFGLIEAATMKRNQHVRCHYSDM